MLMNNVLAIENLLSKLDGVKDRGHGQWYAK